MCVLGSAINALSYGAYLFVISTAARCIFAHIRRDKSARLSIERDYKLFHYLELIIQSRLLIVSPAHLESSRLNVQCLVLTLESV